MGDRESGVWLVAWAPYYDHLWLKNIILLVLSVLSVLSTLFYHVNLPQPLMAEKSCSIYLTYPTCSIPLYSILPILPCYSAPDPLSLAEKTLVPFIY